MKVPSDPKVQQFLSELELLDPQKFEIVIALRQLFFDHFPGGAERVMYGGILFSVDGEDLAGIFSYNHHVSLEFGLGNTFSDPGQLLEGKGKYRRHLKFRTTHDIVGKKTTFYLAQINP